MKSKARKVNEVLKAVVEAITHYEKTGNHKQVTFQYRANKRTPFEFTGWKHEHQEDSPRMILPEEIYVSESGKMLVRGVENRYNLKQFQNQFDNHPRSYRVDRMII